MVTTTASDARRDGNTAAVAASRWTSDRPRRHPVGAGRRRRWPHLFVGVLLVVACAAGVVVLTQQLGERQPVLVVARPVAAGQLLADADLAEARVAAEAGVAVIPASARRQVVGRQAAVDLRPGSLLTEQLLGHAEVPAAGEAVVALSVKPGYFPPRLAAGASVLVVPIVSEGAAKGRPQVAAPETGGWAAVVLDVATAGAQRQQGAVITLRLPDADARDVAALGEDAASVVLTAGGGGG